MKFSIVTLFPEMFLGVFDYSILRRAQEEKKVNINFVNLRDFGVGRHKVVDDKPYGGGIGMVLRVDVLHKAIESVKTGGKRERVALLDARGEVYSQRKAEELVGLDHIILVCGRYEGVDERIKNFVDYTLSVGDYILTGGEVPAMIIVDSIVRLIPSVLSKKGATQDESFSLTNKRRLLEYPQYTRPEKYQGLNVPEVLLSGNDRKIKEYKKKESLELTKKQRPDLI